ncbi:MAG: biotin--[acetyl-CoA-carboxylase] ligase [Planctomycetaceae bacterium]
MSFSRLNLNKFTDFDLRQIARETFLENIDFHQSMDSTNNQALRLAQEPNLSLPCLVLAEKQTAGRGRGNNQWWAQPGCLTFSILLDTTPFKKPEHLPLIALATGWAVANVLEEYTPSRSVQLKWPNDVYLSNRKICGILTEMPHQHRVVVGLGLNVNNSFYSAPDELKSKAISLFDELGNEYPLGMILIDILTQFEILWRQLIEGDCHFIQQWPTRCLLTNRLITHEAGEKQTIGHCRGIDEIGALLLQTEQGTERILGGTITQF